MSRYTTSTSELSFLAGLILIIFGIFAFVPALFLILAISSILNGWVLSILWGWFISPVFGIPVITVGQAIGLAMVVSYLTYQHVDSNTRKNDKTEFYVNIMVAVLLRPLITLGIGYIVHLFV